jgi:hypothetical protein
MPLKFEELTFEIALRLILGGVHPPAVAGGRTTGVFCFFITLEPRVEWYTNL